MKPLQPVVLVLLANSLFVVACSSTSHDNSDINEFDTTVVTDPVAVDPTLFVEGALIGDVTTEECTLNGGTQTSCYRLTIAGAPMDDSVEGPYCPPSITSSADEGGTWFDGSGPVYDVDGDFIVNLPTLYNDDRWQMYDPDSGLVTVIDGAEGCEVAGDPENSSGRDNFCLECTLDALDGGVQQSVLIPVVPVPQGAAIAVGNSNLGVALNGVVLGPPAPVDLILSTITLGVFDDCGGHGNPHEGYHYHAVNGCSEVVGQPDAHASMIGYAMDGYAIYAHLDPEGNAATSLDECGGHTDEVRSYHYHAQEPGSNQIIACYMGERVSTDNGQRRGPPPPDRP